MAILYLKCAEIITKSCCGIYELIYKRGDRRYKIFENEEELNKFTGKNKDIKCENKNLYTKIKNIFLYLKTKYDI
jgi:hypothetical protein